MPSFNSTGGGSPGCSESRAWSLSETGECILSPEEYPMGKHNACAMGSDSCDTINSLELIKLRNAGLVGNGIFARRDRLLLAGSRCTWVKPALEQAAGHMQRPLSLLYISQHPCDGFLKGLGRYDVAIRVIPPVPSIPTTPAPTPSPSLDMHFIRWGSLRRPACLPFQQPWPRPSPGRQLVPRPWHRMYARPAGRKLWTSWTLPGFIVFTGTMIGMSQWFLNLQRKKNRTIHHPLDSVQSLIGERAMGPGWRTHFLGLHGV
jgi:hypothetical protein